ncbi:MAG: sodium:calcium antiporter [Acidobacteria bacterium]|nr:sodium:calcium antiporter [Acidobacteriota bacterium]
MYDYLSLILGVGCAAAGGELFVRGAVGLARWARISPGIIGATVAAFATSSPELSVAVNAAIAGKPQISLGDALGSNVVNVALILGIALLFSGVQSSRGSVKRDFRVAMLAPVIIGILFFDGKLSRLDGIVMLGMFVFWLTAVVVEAARQRKATAKAAARASGWKAALSCIFGLAFLVAAGNLIVTGARGIAVSFGISEFIIGETVVAIGTSMPELATTIIARLRGHDEVGLGTILGSNIFNGLFIIPVAAVICPIKVGLSEVTIALLFGLLAIVFTCPDKENFIRRSRGVILLAIYAAYLLAVILYHRA